MPSKRVAYGFSCLLLAFSFFALFTFLNVARLRTDIAEIKNDIGIEQGKTRKQQAEYDQIIIDLPLAEQSAAELVPLAEAAEAEIDRLKAVRKAMREYVQAIETESGTNPFSGVLSELEQLSARVKTLEQHTLEALAQCGVIAGAP